MSNGSPPIEPAPVPPSIPGIPQPVFGSGSATVPATPIANTGTPIIPPPPIANPVGVPGFPPTPPGTAPIAVPVGPLVGPAVGPAPVPPSVAGIAQPVFIPPGSATVPPGYFPAFTTTPPSPPIVFANIFKIGAIPPPLPSTPGQNPPPLAISSVPTIPQMPWDPPSTRPPVTPQPPINQTPPVVSIISGGGAVGSVIANSTPGTWNPAATSYTRQWQSGGTDIPGATAISYTAQASDIGNQIRVVVTGINADGNAVATSNAVGPITDAEEDPPPEETRRATVHHSSRTNAKKKR